MSLWIQSGESSTTSNAPGAETPGGAEDVTKRSGDRAHWGVDTPNLHSLWPESKRAVYSMSSQASEIRAQAMRARLSTLAEVCAELGVRMPLRKHLAPAMGATERQVQRYMSALIAEGAVAPRTHKNGRVAA